MSGEILAVVHYQVPTVPLTAWEQGGMVVLFAVIFLAGAAFLLNWFSKQQKSWQAFIENRDKEWQRFLEQQRTSDRQARDQDREAIGKITGILQELFDRFGDHDTWERTKLDDMQRSINEPKTQPRRAKG